MMNQKILHEERVYADVLPIVRLYKGFWLSSIILFGLLGLIPIFLSKSYSDSFDSSILLVELGAGLVVYIGVSFVIGVLICKMNKWIGYILLFYCSSTLLFMATALVLVVYSILLEVMQGVHSQSNLLFMIIMMMFIVPFGWFCISGLRAGIRFAFSGDETKQIVSEIANSSSLSSGWFSKMLCMPFPIKHMKKNRTLSITLFALSGVAFSTFSICALFALVFAASPILFSSMLSYRDSEEIAQSQEIETGEENLEEDFSSFIPALIKLSPLIFAGISSTSLVIGLASRTRARKLAISSIRESQQRDQRSPILFLRTFRDDHVDLSPIHLPPLGRLVNLFQRQGSLDIMLLEEGTAYGPVVAIGNPDDPIPAYGASRGYFSDEDWQAAVSELADASRFIVICLDQTEGILWELRHIMARGHEQKTLFIMNPGIQNAKENRAFAQRIISTMLNNSKDRLDLTDLSNSNESILGFFIDENRCAKAGVSREFSEASYLLMVRWFLRKVIGKSVVDP